MLRIHCGIIMIEITMQNLQLKWLGSCLVRIVQLMDLATQEVVYASQDLQVWTVIHQSNSNTYTVTNELDLFFLYIENFQ